MFLIDFVDELRKITVVVEDILLTLWAMLQREGMSNSDQFLLQYRMVGIL